MRIMITGANGPAGIALGDQLAGTEHTVIGVDMDTTANTYFEIIEPICAAREPQMITQLQELVEAHQIDLLIPTVSDELPYVAAATEAGVFGDTLVAIGPHQAVAAAHDKYLTMQALATQNVSIPAFALPSEFADLDEAIAALGTPMIIKPRVARGGRGVQVIEAGETIGWDSLDDSLVLQEFASGIEYAPMVHLMVDDQEPLVVVVEKTELKEGRVGNAVSTELVSGPAVADVAKVAAAAVRGMGLKGAIDLDIRRLPNGRPVVLEINARFGANSRRAPEILNSVLAHAHTSKARVSA